MIIVGITVFTIGLGAVYGLLQENGVAIPVSAAQSNNATYTAVMGRMVTLANSSTYNLTKTTGAAYVASGQQGSNISQSTGGSLSFLGNFWVFGGAIFSVFGYIAAVPQSLTSIQTAITTSAPAVEDVSTLVTYIVLIIAGIAGTLAATFIIFDLISAMTKYRV